MAEPIYAFIIWDGSLQKSVVKCSTITNGMAAAKQKVTAKWKAKQYAATVIQTGNYETLVQCIMYNYTNACFAVLRSVYMTY